METNLSAMGVLGIMNVKIRPLMDGNNLNHFLLFVAMNS